MVGRPPRRRRIDTTEAERRQFQLVDEHVNLQRVEVLLDLDSPAVTDRPDVGHLRLAFLGLPVKSEVIVAESNNPLASVALKDVVRVKHEFVETRS